MANALQNDFELTQVASPEQVVQARELFLEYAAGLGFSLCFQNFDDELRNLPGAYVPPPGRLLLVIQSNQPAGCIALRPLEEGVCEMKRLYVRPAHRGKGLGRILVDRIISEARTIGYERMRLDTVSSSMQDAIALYRKRGFKEIPAYCDNPNVGVLYMELTL
jgi:ribosomal protein S18 acetylase RimI-like enzyme